MKGMLHKDLYLLRASLPLAVIVVLVIGVGMSVLVTPNIYLVMMPVVLGMLEVNTINMDKKSGWHRLSPSMPAGLPRGIGAKYLMYLLVTLGGLFVALILTAVVSTVFDMWAADVFGIFLVIGITFPLVSGAMGLPAAFLWDEEKNMIVTLISYPLASMVFVALALGIGNIGVVMVLFLAVSVAAYAFSWLWTVRFLPQRDLA